MKRTRINKGYVGLVFKDGDYQRVLEAGTYWIGFGETAVQYNLSERFSSNIELNVLLEDEKLAAMMHVIEISDQEFGILYRDGIYLKVLEPGRYAYWKGPIAYECTVIDLSDYQITQNIPKHVLVKSGLVAKQRVYPVENYERALLFVDGEFVAELGPGVYSYWKNPQVIQVYKADIRTRQLEINGQEILTRDKAALRLNFQVQYRVTDLQKVLIDNKQYESQLYTQVQQVIRDLVGKLTFDELLERKNVATSEVLEMVSTRAVELGIEVINCGIKDIILPGDMKEIMNQVLMAQKKAQANSIMRREETASTRSLLNTAKLMEDNQMLYKLKEMEYVEKIADKIDRITLGGGSQVVDQLKDIFTS